MAKLEFFFDCSSPWTYLAFSRLESLVERTGADIVWKPILVGGVFNAVNDGVYEARANPNPVKSKYYFKDLQDWARFCGVTIGKPSVFPVRAVTMMRGAYVALDQGRLQAYAWACFEKYWGELKDVSDNEVLAEICEEADLDADLFFKGVQDASIKDRLKQTTDDLINRGGFGSPTYFVDETDMYFGNDRLELVETALLARS